MNKVILISGHPDLKNSLSNRTILEELKKLQDTQNFTKLMVVQEELKTLPFEDVWNAYCQSCGKPLDGEWFEEVDMSVVSRELGVSGSVLAME